MKLNYSILAFGTIIGVFFVTPLRSEENHEFKMRYRVETQEDSGFFHTVTRNETWAPKKTALIICDMWDAHHCYNAVQREKEFAPRLDEVSSKLREAGVTIIHAPSSCMDFYKDHPARQRAIDAPESQSLPDQIEQWCHKIPSEERGQYPIDQSDGGEDDDPVEHAAWAKKLEDMGLNPRAPWKRQIDVLTINEQQDYVSDSGREIWNVLTAKGIDNVLLAGVHTNMCVLGRPFGLRQMARNGKNVALIRDLTDTMYNPGARPYVSHFTGTDLIIEHIEKFVCPTVTSDQILGGEAFRFSKDRRPHILILVAEREYKTDESLRKFSIELGKTYETSFVFADSEDKNLMPGLDAITRADLLLVSVRRRTLKTEQLELIRNYVASGKPVVGIRTANHAFCLRKGVPSEGYSQWLDFDREVFGGNYTNHYGSELETRISFANITHSILNEIPRKGFVSSGSLYRVSPLQRGANVMLYGEVKGAPREPVAWTYIRSDGGRSFYTSLGHSDDFALPEFNRLLFGGVRWAVGTEKRR